MYYLDKDCVYDVSGLDVEHAKELFELLIFNDKFWTKSKENNFNYIVRILTGDSYDTCLYYNHSEGEWFFDSPACVDMEYIEAEISIEDVLFFEEKVVEKIKFNNKVIIVV